jgi:hypothetical protein
LEGCKTVFLDVSGVEGLEEDGGGPGGWDGRGGAHFAERHHGDVVDAGEGFEAPDRGEVGHADAVLVAGFADGVACGRFMKVGAEEALDP